MTATEKTREVFRALMLMIPLAESVQELDDWKRLNRGSIDRVKRADFVLGQRLENAWGTARMKLSKAGRQQRRRG